MNTASRTKEMVHQILIFSRRRELEKRLISLPPLVREVVDLLKTSLPSTIEIRLTLDMDEASVMGDPTQTHQVITNLGTNAAYAMQDHGGVLALSLDRLNLEEGDLASNSSLRNKENQT